MKKKRMLAMLGCSMLAMGLFVLVSTAWGQEQMGLMTGGGSIFTTTNDVPVGARITHGFHLHCALTDDQGAPIINPPNNLQINIHLPNGTDHRFHLEKLTFAQCLAGPPPDPPGAPFYWYNGAGEGRYDGVSGYCAAWIFTDEGEPGSNDRIVSLRIGLPDSSLECNFSEVSVGNEGETGGRNLHFGNHQAHRATHGRPLAR